MMITQEGSGITLSLQTLDKVLVKSQIFLV